MNTGFALSTFACLGVSMVLIAVPILVAIFRGTSDPAHCVCGAQRRNLPGFYCPQCGRKNRP